MIVVHNFAAEPRSVTLDASEDTLVSLLTDDHSRSKSGMHRITLDAYGYCWYRVGGLTHILDRER